MTQFSISTTNPEVAPQSFTREVKEEVAMMLERSPEESRAFLSAFIKLNGNLLVRENRLGLSIRTENKKIAKLLFLEIKKNFGVDARIIVSEKKRLKRRGDNTVIFLEIHQQVRLILEELEIMSNTMGSQINPSYTFLKDLELARHYLAGAFLASGSVNSPQTSNYHLEIGTTDEKYAQYLVRQMKRFYLDAKIVKRRNQHVVYLKRSEQIADFLRILSASKALIHFENIRIQRDSINSVVRVTNCDIANEMRIQEVGTRQQELLLALEARIGLNHLDDNMYALAQVRLEHPDASLSELSDHYYEKTHQRLTKSGINHRMQKLITLAKRLTNEEEYYGKDGD